MKTLGVIPSRLGAVRLPEKPLRLIAGKPLIEHVCRNVKKAKLLQGFVVATDSKEIFETVENLGYQAVMTSVHHASGTERIAEVAKKFKQYDTFVNIQGDEPLLQGTMIDRLLKEFKKEKTAPIASCYLPKIAAEEFENPNVVKVVLDKKGYALYFSRSPIPFDRSGEDTSFMKHLGIYAYKRKFLLGLSKLKTSQLENREKLEQLKWLDNGFKIRMIASRTDSIGVDTKEDLMMVENLLKKKEKAFA